MFCTHTDLVVTLPEAADNFNMASKMYLASTLYDKIINNIILRDKIHSRADLSLNTAILFLCICNFYYTHSVSDIYNDIHLTCNNKNAHVSMLR